MKLPLKSRKDYNDAYDLVLQTSVRHHALSMPQLNNVSIINAAQGFDYNCCYLLVTDDCKGVQETS